MDLILPAIAFALTAASLVLVARILASFARDPERILAMGVPATGVVSHAAQTGTYIDGRPLVIVTVEVHSGLGAPYRAQVTQAVCLTRLQQLRAGAPLTLRVHPRNPNQIALA